MREAKIEPPTNTLMRILALNDLADELLVDSSFRSSRSPTQSDLAGHSKEARIIREARDSLPPKIAEPTGPAAAPATECSAPCSASAARRPWG